MTKSKRTYVYYPDDEIGSSDLLEIRERDEGEARVVKWGTWQTVNAQGYIDSVYYDYLYIDGRLGIAEGGDSTWADVDSVEQGLDIYLNDPEEWEHRG